MPSYNVTAIVLRRANAGETDRIVTIFTSDRGKIAVVARGARKPGSRLAGLTEPFTIARLQVATARSLDVIAQADVLTSFAGLRDSVGALARASCVCELLDKMTHEHDDHAADRLFALTERALQLIERGPAEPDCILLAYQLKLLSTLGYLPELQHCVHCGAAIARGGEFSPGAGGPLCEQHRDTARDSVAVSSEGLGLLRALATSGSAGLATMSPPQRPMEEARRVLDAMVHVHTGRELSSVRFLRSLRESPDAPA